MDGILDAAVIGVPDAIYGEVPKAVIVLAKEGALSAQEILAFARRKLAKYKVPHIVEIVPEMPRNPSGKILKHVLRMKEANTVR